MKLSTRLIAVTVGTVFIASTMAGLLLVRLERGQLVTDEVNESRVLIRSLQVSIENALRDGQDPDISELLQRLELVAHEVDVLVFAPGADSPSFASVHSDVDNEGVRIVRLLTNQLNEAYRLIKLDSGELQLVSGVPLRTDAGQRIGTLVLNRPLSELQADLRSTTLLTVLSVLIFAVTTTLVMLVLLRREVTTPLRRFSAAAVSIAHDLQAPLSLPPERSVELDAVRKTLLDLQTQLLSAQDERQRQAREREELERRLAEADKLIIVGQLASGVAHEIGSPLQVLVGRLRLLADDAAQSSEGLRQIGLIEEQAARISAIVARLQDVVRRRPSRMRPIDLAQPVQKVVWLLEPEARRRGATLSWHVPEQPITVMADPDEVQQIVLNLTLNALQAVEARATVAVSVRSAGDGGALVVVDDGNGMDETIVDRAFEPFFTTRVDAGGTGLGLAVVRSIVDRHRATLTLESRPQLGTSVTVTWQE